MLQPIIVTSQVTADFTTISSNEGCGSLVVEFQDLSTGSPNAWLWDFGNGNTSNLKNPTAIYTSPGLYNVKLKVSNSLINDSIISYGFIKVYENPDVDFQKGISSYGCIPFEIEFLDMSTSFGTITSWQWDFGDGGSSIMQNPSYIYNLDGEFAVSLSIIDTNGCETLYTDTNLIRVDNNPISSFEVDLSSSCNVNQTVNFTNNSSNAIDFLWDFGDGSQSFLQDPSHLYSSGTYTVSLVAISGNCRDTLKMIDLISIGDSLQTNFTFDNSSICEESQINFTDYTLNSPENWIWNFGDGNTSQLQNPSHIYDSSGTYDVSLTTFKNGGQCSSTSMVFAAIEVLSNPQVDILVDTSYSCSIPLDVQFNDNTNGSVYWNWVFSNGITSSFSNPQVSFNNFGNYDVQLTVKNSEGCLQTINFEDIIVLENIETQLYVESYTACTSSNLNFFDSTVSFRPLVEWSWDFGDGNFSSLQNPFHQYSNVGQYNVNLSVKNDYGCTSTVNFPTQILVSEYPSVDFEVNPLVSCVGDDVFFDDLSISFSTLIDEWQWSFGDGNISQLQNSVYQYEFPGLYDITLIVSSAGCSDTLVIEDYIKIVEPVAKFEELYNCDDPFFVKFNNISVGGDSVFWDFGDGSTSNDLNPTHIYSNRGTYDVLLSVYNSFTDCNHQLIKKITITDPIAEFDYLLNANNGYEDSLGCAPHKVYLDNKSQDCAYFQVRWSDGYVSYGEVDHILDSAGYKSVEMIVTDIHGCKDTMYYENMYKISDVDADFQMSSLFGCDSVLVSFENFSVGSNTFLWDFGDGNFSSANNPQHIYISSDSFNVTLYVESSDGCKDTLQKNQIVELHFPLADFEVSNQEVCPNEQLSFINNSDGLAVSSAWDFGDGNQSNDNDPIHSYSISGVYDLTLTVIDSFGCSSTIFYENHIIVKKPISNFSANGLSSVCPPLISNFSSQSSSDVINWFWDFGDGTISTLENPTNLYISSGVYDVTLVVENTFGCKDTLKQLGIVDIAGPSGTFNISDTVICEGDSVSFVPNTQNTDFYIWNFGDGTISFDSAACHSYILEGVYQTNLVLENLSGCQFIVDIDQDIYVSSINIDGGFDVSVCKGGSVELSAVGDGFDFFWEPSSLFANAYISNPFVIPYEDIMLYVYHTDGVCQGVDSVFVTVFDSVPEASFMFDNACEGDTINLIASSGLSTSNISYQWSFGGVNYNESIILQQGEHDITLIVENLDNNCLDTVADLIEVYALPEISFSASEVCLGEEMFFIDLSVDDLVSWFYDFGDGSVSSLQNPSHFYQDHGFFNPTLTGISSLGCLNTYSIDIKVNELPNPNFSMENACEGESHFFSDLSFCNSDSVVFHEYNFDDGYFSNNSAGYHNFNKSGVYDVKLSVGSDKNCFSSVIKQVEVYKLPKVSLDVNNFCVKTATKFFSYSNLDDSEITSYLWHFGDSNGFSTYKNPYYIYSVAGNYNVSLQILDQKGCENSAVRKIAVYDLPKISLSSLSEVCVGEEFFIVDSSYVENSSLTNWKWDFGDGTIKSGKKVSHVYEFSGIYDVSLSLISNKGCLSDTLFPNLVSVNSRPKANFNASSLNVSELASEISFFNTSEEGMLLNWNFGNGMISSEESEKINFDSPGLYDVSLVVTNEFGCSDEITKRINVFPEYSVYIPNSFSPNGDGINDFFTVSGKEVSFFNIIIYNRFGEVVFESESLSHLWDGKDSLGSEVVSGTYIYSVTAYDLNNRRWDYNGEVNLFR